MTQVSCRATAPGCQSLERQATRLPYNSYPRDQRNLRFNAMGTDAIECLEHTARFFLFLLLFVFLLITSTRRFIQPSFRRRIDDKIAIGADGDNKQFVESFR